MKLLKIFNLYWAVGLLLIGLGIAVLYLAPDILVFKRIITEDWQKVEQLNKDSVGLTISQEIDNALPIKEVEVDISDGSPAPSTLEARLTAYTKFDEGVNCISASQKNICWKEERFCACPPIYEFGTRFEINNEIYTCVDRMNKYHRGFDNHFDLWFDDDLIGALGFGVKIMEIKVLEQ